MYMQKIVLIVSYCKDIHVKYLLPILKRRHQNYFLLNLDQFPKDYQMNQMYIEGEQVAEIKHIPTNTRLNLSKVGSIWLRKPAEYKYLSNQLSTQEKAYAKLETEQTIFGMLYGLDCYWISHPLALRGSIWKGEQLNRAASMGFKIPNSLLSNVPDKVRKFKTELKNALIVKSMSTPTLGAECVSAEDVIARCLTTTIVTDEMMQSIESIQELACQFQEYIPKAFELRVTIIGDKVFAAKLHSQQDEMTKIDSRDISVEIQYEAFHLPVDVERKCLKFVKSYGLNFSALDLIVTPEGEYVFLENNPNGQFLYVEQLVPEFHLFEELADCLIKSEGCQR